MNEYFLSIYFQKRIIFHLPIILIFILFGIPLLMMDRMSVGWNTRKSNWLPTKSYYEARLSYPSRSLFLGENISSASSFAYFLWIDIFFV